MKRKLLILFSVISISAMAQQPLKVAFIGNSITYGAGVVNPQKNSYPVQTGYFLGDGYQVANFGVSATTMLSNGNSPYINTDQYKASKEYNPDIVVIKLGTNDAKSFNRDKIKEGYKRDYQAVIDSYKALPSKPRIILLNPVRCYVTEGDFAGANEVYESQTIPAIEELAYENSLEIVDLYHAFDQWWNETNMPDRLHPSSLGATIMAERVADQIARPATDFRINVPSTSQFNFHGYRGYKMGQNMVVEPKRAAQGNPWVIRARFWGHEPQTDIALLEKGFHIAYCDVADLYGSPEACRRYDDFYKKMVSAGLSKKVVLEGMSRGGLIVFNWAAKNPDKVAAIYADAPVLDFKSWPMGLGKGYGSPGDTDNLLKAYGFKSIEEAKKWKKNPIDQTAVLSKIPILLVVGDADKVVPIAENSDIFEAKIRNIKVIHKPGIGHHPHSLYNPRPIVDFIVKATGHWSNPCINPLPASEYRSGAGWAGGSDWHAVAQEISDVLATRKVDVLLIGNSITQGFGTTSRKLIGAGEAREAMDKLCPSWEGAGIAGDRTQHVLWRILNGNYKAAQPKKVFITIGVNNLVAGDDSGQDTAEGVIAVAEAASREFAEAEIYIFGMLPVGFNPTDAVRQKHDEAHKVLANAKLPANVKYLNLAPFFTLPDGKLNQELYISDNLHLSSAGYAVWIKALAELL